MGLTLVTDGDSDQTAPLIASRQIIKRDYKNDYVVVDEKRRRNHQCNYVCIIKVKKTKKCTVTEAEFDAGKISLFCVFSRSSHRSSGNPSSPPPQCKNNNDDRDNNERGGKCGGGQGGG